MPPQLLNHTCGFYCTGTSHVIEAIGLPHIAPQTILDGYNAYIQRYGWLATAIRAAPEADPAAWFPKMGWHWNTQSNRRGPGPGIIPTEEVYCWLVTIEWQGGEHGESE
jgi:hypothetical protein